VRARRQAADQMRKLPKQARARDTLEIIFEATTQLLERDGRVGLSTNAIAERAGISIGTLYHYFPSKEAILVATARREMAAHRAAVTRALTDSSTEGHAEPKRHVLRALLGASDKRTKARRIATETLIAQDLSHEIAQPVRRQRSCSRQTANEYWAEPGPFQRQPFLS